MISAHTDKPARPSIPPRRSSSSAVVSTLPSAAFTLYALSTSRPSTLEGTERLVQTHGKDYDDFPLAFHYDGQIKPHLEALERFVDEDILDLICRYEARSRGGEVGG